MSTTNTNTYRICGTEFTFTYQPQQNDTEGRMLCRLQAASKGHILSTTESTAPLFKAVIDHIGTHISQRHTFSEEATQYAHPQITAAGERFATFTAAGTIQDTPGIQRIQAMLEELQTNYANKAPEALIHSHTRLVRSKSLNPQVEAVNSYLDQQAAALGLSETQLRALKNGIEGALTRATVPTYYRA
jgi:hypothetical protein